MNDETDLLLKRVQMLAELEDSGAPMVIRALEVRLIGDAFDALIQGHIERGERLIDAETEAAIERRLHVIGAA